MRLVEYWVLSPAGTLVCPLPDVVSWTLSPVLNDAGSAEVVYPTTGTNWAVLHQCVTQDRRVDLQVRIDDVVHPELQVTLFEAGGDDVVPEGTWSYRGRLPLGRLLDAVIEPQGGMPAQGGDDPTDQDARYYSCTAGTIMATCLVEAQARGALTDVTHSFTNTVDTNGVSWSKIITLKFSPGLDYLKVLSGLVDAGLCEARMVGTDLRLYEPGTLGVDRTQSTPPLVFRTGQSLTDSPRKHTTSDLATAVLVTGAEGTYEWASDTTALTRLGRRIETATSQGSIKDPTTLTAYATTYLQRVVAGRMQKTHGGTVEAGPIPIRDFEVGDWSWSDLGNGLEKLRVAQWVLAMDSDGTLTWTAALNDLIAERDAALARRIQGIEGGSTILGTSQARPVIPEGPDTLAPGAPTGVAVNSLAQPDADAIPRAAVITTWNPVVVNADSTAIDDLAGYLVQYRYTDPALVNNWAEPVPLVTSGTSADWGDVIAGTGIEVRVAAADYTGNRSAWSTSAFHTTQSDATAPPTPSTPVVTEFLGTLTVAWNGLGSIGQAMPSDFAGVQIHRSTANGFTPGPSTFLEILLGPGSRNYPDLPYGTVQYFRLIAVDKTGNTSTASAQGSGTPAEIGMDSVAFADAGNLVEDGSFELAGSRATHAARSSASWTFMNSGADHGDWCAQGTGATGSGVRTLVLSPLIPCRSGQQYAYRLATRRSSAANGDLVTRVRFYLADGSTIDSDATFTVGETADTWVSKIVSYFTAPANTEALDVRIVLAANNTAGNWSVDRVELREAIGSLLIQNAAITNAKIASLDAGKITAGTVTAVMLMAGLLRSATSGYRFELDAAGLRLYDAAGNVRVNLDTATAMAVVTGTLQTGITGQRIVISGAGNEIRFYPQAGETRYAKIYSYIPANFPNDVAMELLTLDSDSSSWNARHWLLPDSQAISVCPKGDGGGLVSKADVTITSGGVAINYRNIVGSPPYTGSSSTDRAIGSVGESVISLEMKAGSSRDGGYLLLSRSGDTVLGKKNASVDNYFRFTSDTAQLIRQGEYRFNTVHDGMEIHEGVFTPRVASIGNGRAYLAADAGGDIFFYWSGGSLNIGTGASYVKTFVIDHPVKNNRYLVHGTTESPHAGVEYWGEAIVEDGECEVILPDYFEALTRSEGRNVQVTVIAERQASDRAGLPRKRPRRDPPKRPDRAPHRFTQPDGTEVVVPDPPPPSVPMGLPVSVQATLPRDGRFTIYAVGPVDTVRVSWLVKAIRKDVPELLVEPDKGAGRVMGVGPYTYLVAN